MSCGKSSFAEEDGEIDALGMPVIWPKRTFLMLWGFLVAIAPGLFRCWTMAACISLAAIPQLALASTGDGLPHLGWIMTDALTSTKIDRLGTQCGYPIWLSFAFGYFGATLADSKLMVAREPDFVSATCRLL